jgi:hypothetical protein
VVLRRIITTPPQVAVDPGERDQEVRSRFRLAASLMGGRAAV